MAQIQFFEKPGCVGNARQKQVLNKAGHELQVMDLLTFPWTREKLSPFLSGRAVGDWFNRTAPAVKSGDIDPDRLDAEQALDLLLETPLLIRRPLMVVDGQYFTGFDLTKLAPWLPDATGDYETCPTPAVPCDP